MKLDNEHYPSCATCNIYACRSGHVDKAPNNCPMINEKELLNGTMKDYEKISVKKIACTSARVESEGYCNWTRIEEIIDFARKNNFNKLGLAFCSALRKEASLYINIMAKYQFEIISVVCKTGAFSKDMLGLQENEKIRPGQFEAMCNPIAQAKLLNKSQTELNIILGLCVGHDTLFIKYSESPVTVLATKDRVLAHNPLGALYAYNYFPRRFK